RRQDAAHPQHPPAHPGHLLADGHRDRVRAVDRDGPGRRHGHHPQEPVHHRPDPRGRQGKRSENGIITDPITLPPTETVRTAKRIMEQHKISGVPITVNGYLKGILTRRDLRFLQDMDQALAEVMTRTNLITAPETTTLEAAERI